MDVLIHDGDSPEDPVPRRIADAEPAGVSGWRDKEMLRELGYSGRELYVMRLKYAPKTLSEDHWMLTRALCSRGANNRAGYLAEYLLENGARIIGQYVEISNLLLIERQGTFLILMSGQAYPQVPCTWRKNNRKTTVDLWQALGIRPPPP